MTKKGTIYPTAAQKRSIAKAVADSERDAAAKRGDPTARVEAARRRVADTIDRLASRAPGTSPTTKQAKKGNHRP